MSHRGGSFAAEFASRAKQLHVRCRYSRLNSLSNQLSNQLSDQLSNQLSDQLPDQLADQLSDQLSNQQTDQLSNQLSNQRLICPHMDTEMGNFSRQQRSHQVKVHLIECSTPVDIKKIAFLRYEMDCFRIKPLTLSWSNKIINSWLFPWTGIHLLN